MPPFVLKNTSFILNLLFIFILAPSTTLSGPKEDKVIVLATGEWPPYTSLEVKHYGLCSRIVTEAFAQEGYRTRYTFLPWKRSLTLTKAALFTGSFPWQATPSRRRDFLISQPLISTKTVFFHKSSYDFHWHRLADLKDLHLGITRGYAYMADFRAKLEGLGIKYSESNTDVINLKLLLKGHIDIFPLEKDVGLFLLAKHFPVKKELITYHSKPMAQTQQTVLFPKSSPDSKLFQDVFNRGINKLRSSGQLQVMRDIHSWKSPDKNCQ